jgi:hypothetical protein
MKTDYLRLVKNYVSRQIPKYRASPLNCLITLFLSTALVNDYLALFRSSNASSDGQPADSKTSILWSALDLLDETAQKVDGNSLNLFRLLNDSGPNTAGMAKIVREFIRESNYALTPDICAKICTKLLKVRFALKREINKQVPVIPQISRARLLMNLNLNSNRSLVLVLNFFRFIILPLLKDAGPSQELCKQLKVAKERVYAACDPSVSWIKEDVTRTWLEVDAYVMVSYNIDRPFSRF